MMTRSAARIRWSNWFFPRKLSLTREGKYVILIALGIGFGAINSGTNLLFLILGMLLSLIVLSGILSELNLRRISLTTIQFAPAHANQSVEGFITIENGKRRLPSFCLSIELYWSREVVQGPCYLLKLAPGEKRQVYFEALFAQRGEYTLREVRIATLFPFSFFKKSRSRVREHRVVVYPELRPISYPLGSPSGYYGLVAHNKEGRGDSYYGLRDFRSGDDLKRVHWRTTARTGQLMVREFEDERSQTVVLCVENIFSALHLASIDVLERVISEAASIAREYIRRGYRVGLATLSGSVPADMGRHHLHHLFHHLALLPILHTDEDDVGYTPRAVPAIGNWWERTLVKARGTPMPSSAAGYGRVIEVELA